MSQRVMDYGRYAGKLNFAAKPVPKAFYEGALGKLSRPSRGWSRSACPFHPTKSKTSFSVNLESGGYFCHGCGAKGGDVIAFTMALHSCDFKAACQLLGCWDSAPTPERLQAMRDAQQRRAAAQEAKRVEEEETRRQRLAVRDEIHLTATILREAGDRLSQLAQGAAPAYEGEAEDCWGVLALAHEDLSMSASEYTRMCGFAEWEVA